MGFHLQSNVLKEIDNIVHITEIGRLSFAQEQQTIEHVKHLRRRLMHGYDNGFVLLGG